jgi:hypothetical protein
MNKTSFIVLLVSLTLTSLVSTLFGFAGQTIIGTFWGWFWVSLLLQFIGFVAYNSYLIQKDDIAMQKAEVETLEQLAKFSIQINCAYCNQSNVTPIQLNKRNTFKCESCNQVNGVSMQFMATTITTPIQSVKLPLSGSESIEIKMS